MPNVRGRSVRAFAIVAVTAVVVGACGGDSDDDSGETGSLPTDEASATPTPTATTTRKAEAPREVDVPEGLKFTKVPDVSGAKAGVLNAYLTYEAEWWRSATEDKLSPAFGKVASGDLVADLEGQLQTQKDEGFRLGGKVTFKPNIRGVNDNVAVISSCMDQSGVTVVRDGDETPGSDAQENPFFVVTADLTKLEGQWRVNSYNLEAKEC